MLEKKINEKKRKNMKVEKKTEKKEKVSKKKGEESLWITVVIHGVLCVGEQ
jgi:hypothetical protein